MNKVVLFYSDNCGPCNALRPILEELLTAENIELEKVCVDTEAGAKHAELHEVRGWPTVYGVRDNIIIAEMMGADPNGSKEQHEERIKNEILAKFN
jgi:thioredoxin-like negative regulator of GroEL